MTLSIGPVQEFIAEARKVRDLWAGSYILASASFNAAVPFLRHFGPDVVLHPHLHESTLFAKWLCRQYDCPSTSVPASVQRMASIPNKLLAVVPFDLVESLGQEALACFKEEFWVDVGKAVWENSRSQFGQLVNEQHWTAQTNSAIAGLTAISRAFGRLHFGEGLGFSFGSFVRSFVQRGGERG
jgi:CRISPR-associated protein Cas10/Cmr2 subtype III-B